MTWYYRQRGEYQKAYDTRLEIAAIYRQKGLDFEAEIELESAKELKKEMENKS